MLLSGRRRWFRCSGIRDNLIEKDILTFSVKDLKMAINPVFAAMVLPGEDITVKKIAEYQIACWNKYKASIGYPDSITYLFGNKINVQVPVETAFNKVMIVGAYPSAKFYWVGNVRDVPLSDNDAPFSNETYFDGKTVRTIP